MKGIFKKPESESGAAIIEFALGVPFLLIFAMAAMEFGQISADIRCRQRRPCSRTRARRKPRRRCLIS